MNTLQKGPTWFKLTIAVLLLWNLMGVLNFVMQWTMTKEDILMLTENE